MKKFFMVLIMVMVTVVSNAQMIIGHSAGNIYLDNGMVVDASRIPNSHMLREGEDISYGIQRAQMEERLRLQREATIAAYSDMYAMAANAVYGGACYGGAVAVPVGGGYESSGFSIGNGHWGVSTSKTKCGAYESSANAINIGGFHVNTHKSGINKKAASNMRSNNVAATGTATRSTTNTYNNVREVNINDLMRNYK